MTQFGIAALLSALFPGAGQLYKKEWSKGIFFFASSLLLGGFLRRNIPMSAFSAGKPLAHSGAFLFLVFVLLTLSVWSVVDAYRAKPSSRPL